MSAEKITAYDVALQISGIIQFDPGDPHGRPAKASISIDAAEKIIQRFRDAVVRETLERAAKHIDAPIIDKGKVFAKAIRSLIHDDKSGG